MERQSSLIVDDRPHSTSSLASSTDGPIDDGTMVTKNLIGNLKEESKEMGSNEDNCDGDNVTDSLNEETKVMIKKSIVPNIETDALYGRVLGPIMSQLDELAKKNDEIMNNLMEELEEKKKKEQLDIDLSHIPQLLRDSKKNLNEIVDDSLECLIKNHFQEFDKTSFIPRAHCRSYEATFNCLNDLERCQFESILSNTSFDIVNVKSVRDLVEMIRSRLQNDTKNTNVNNNNSSVAANVCQEMMISKLNEQSKYTANLSITNIVSYATSLLSYLCGENGIDAILLPFITRTLSLNVIEWLTRIYRFPSNSHLYLHHDIWDGCVRLARYNLCRSYPNYSRDGYLAFDDHAPVIYLSSGGGIEWTNYLKNEENSDLLAHLKYHLATELALPCTSIRLLPSEQYEDYDRTLHSNENKKTKSHDKPSIVSKKRFEMMLMEDLMRGNLPLMVIGWIGTPGNSLGFIDPLNELREIANRVCGEKSFIKFPVWFHAQGDLLATLPMIHNEIPSKVLTTIDSMNSMTLNFGQWLGVSPGIMLPNITLYHDTKPFKNKEEEEKEKEENSEQNETSIKENVDEENKLKKKKKEKKKLNEDYVNMYHAGLLPENVCVRSGTDTLLYGLRCVKSVPLHLQGIFQYWFLLQHLGYEGLISRIRQTCELGNRLARHLMLNDVIKICSYHKVAKDGNEEKVEIFSSFSQLLTDVIDSLLAIDYVNPIVVFRFEPTNVSIPDKRYVDLLNYWLFDNLIHLTDQLHNNQKNIIRKFEFDFIHLSSDVEQMNKKQSKKAIRFIPFQHSNLLAIQSNDLQQLFDYVDEKIEIISATFDCRQLLLELEKNFSFADNLKFIPLDDWPGIGGIRYISDGRSDDQLDMINERIVQELRRIDSAFTMTSAIINTKKIKFIRLGMMTTSLTLNLTLKQIVEIGNRIIDEDEQLQFLSQKVQEGIREASSAIERENQRIRNEEGVVRKIPLVGNLYNWWSPYQVEKKGQCFSLQKSLQPHVLYTAELMTTELEIVTDDETEDTISVSETVNNLRKIPSDTSSKSSSILNGKLVLKQRKSNEQLPASTKTSNEKLRKESSTSNQSKQQNIFHETSNEKEDDEVLN
ncbi:hypothetical protein SNEBB_006966 [Seison nebaliae]|nr:hypothetical protein SNEBB_006966 [Seison nebaliae]